MKKIFIPCIAILFSLACSHNEQQAQEQAMEMPATTDSKPQLDATRSFTDLTLDDKALLITFYGTAEHDPSTKKFKSVLSLPLQIEVRPETKELIESAEDESIEISVADKKLFGAQNQFCLFMTDGFIKGNDCHPCGGTLGMFILKKNEKGKWDCISHNYDIRQQGSFGSISTNAVIYEIANDEYMVDLSSGYSQMGYSMQTEYNFILLDGSYDPIDIATSEEMDAFYYDNAGTCDTSNPEAPYCFEFSSELNFVPTDARKYMDLKIITKGTYPNEEDSHQPAAPYYRERVYQWRLDKYVLFKDERK